MYSHAARFSVVGSGPPCLMAMPLNRRHCIGVGGRIPDKAVGQVDRADRLEQHAVELEQAAIQKQFDGQTLFDTTDKG